MKTGKVTIIVTWIVTLFISLSAQSASLNDPLPSWNDGGTKEAIINFVTAVTDKASPHYVAPENRIATIDNDGTLWVEQPMYTQIIFSITRFKEMAPQHPEWKKQPAIQSILKKEADAYTGQDIERIVALTSAGMSVDDYAETAKTWLDKAENTRFKHHYTDLIYQPMLEVIQYLTENHFKTYIVSGGGQAFIRVFSLSVYGVPPEQVIGTAGKTQYHYDDKKPVIMNLPEILFVSDQAGKPEAINLFIGKKPIIAFGNSDGDRQMLEWTQSGKGRRLMLLVHHDDAKREYAYDTQSKVGTFSKSLFEEAGQNHWQIISMKKDWKVIFPFESRSH